MFWATSGSVMLSGSSVATAPGGDDGRADVVGLHLLPQPFGDDPHGCLRGRIHGTPGSHLVACDGRDNDDVTVLLRFHGRKRGCDAVENALEVHIDHAVPVLDFAALEERVRHETRIVDDHVDAPVPLDGKIDQTCDLLAIGHVRLYSRAFAQGEFRGERLKPFEAPRAQHQLSATPSKMTRSRFAKSTACACDDNNFAGNTFLH